MGPQDAAVLPGAKPHQAVRGISPPKVFEEGASQVLAKFTPSRNLDTMGKKRKAASQAYNNAEQTTRPDRAELTINTYQDVADSEDEFLDNRDRILLDEGPDVKRRRKIQEQGALSRVCALG